MALLGSNAIINAATNVKVVAVSLAGVDSVLRLDGAGGLPFNNASAQLVGTTVVGGVTQTSNLAILSAQNVFTDTQLLTPVTPGNAGLFAKSGNAAVLSFIAIGRASIELEFGVSGGAAGFLPGDVAGDTVIATLSAAKALHLASGASTAAALKLLGQDTFASGDLKLVTAGKGIFIKEGGGAATSGKATLVGGTVTVNTLRVTANSRIQLTGQSGGSGTAGFLRESARTPGASFTILSSSGTDAHDVAWTLIEPSP